MKKVLAVLALVALLAIGFGTVTDLADPPSGGLSPRNFVELADPPPGGM